MLRNRLVCGIRNEEIQRKLLADPALIFTTAMDITLAGETALRQALEIRGSNNDLYKPVNLIKVKTHNRSSKDKPTA